MGADRDADLLATQGPGVGVVTDRKSILAALEDERCTPRPTRQPTTVEVEARRALGLDAYGDPRPITQGLLHEREAS